MKIYALKYRSPISSSQLAQGLSNYPEPDQGWKFEAAFTTADKARGFADVEFGRIDWEFDRSGSGSWSGVSTSFSREYLVETIEVRE